MRKPELLVLCGFYDYRSKSKQFVRKLITLQMSSDLLVCKAICQKMFTQVLLGLMVRGQAISTVLVQCRAVGGSPGLSLSGRPRVCWAILPCAETLEFSLSERLVPMINHIPCSPDFLKGGIRKPLPHFGAWYHLLSAVFTPFMIFVSFWVSGWDAWCLCCPGHRNN